MNKYFFFIIIFFSIFCIAATNFDELDKPPEGAYSGQIFVGGSLFMGMPFGSIIKGEKDFIEDSTYTFSETETTKLIEITHLCMGLNIFAEYMPFDHIGTKLAFQNLYIVQRSRFGTDYSNKKGNLYKDYAFLLGPVFHLTYRKAWDVTLQPIIGLAYQTFEATPVAKKLIDNYNPSAENARFSALYGAELQGVVYFSGGLFISLGMQWLYLPIKFSESADETNPQTNNQYLDGKNKGTINSVSLIFSAGYAFYN